MLEAHSSLSVPAPAVFPLILNAAPIDLLPAALAQDAEANVSGTPPPGELPGCPLPLRV
jgi:hypothetical protein